MFQAFVFYMPRIFWRSMSKRSGLDLTDLVNSAHNYKSAENFNEREKHITYMVSNIDQYVDDSRRYDKNRPVSPIKQCLACIVPCAGTYLGNYLVVLYFMVKLIYIFNTLFQMLILSGIFGKSFYEFGFYFIHRIFTGGGWSIESKYFPSKLLYSRAFCFSHNFFSNLEIVLCDFSIREIGNLNKLHKYTVQCVLPINLFNQQIFMVIWFWYFLVLFLNIIELINWSMKTANGAKWARKHVRLSQPNIDFDTDEFLKKRLEHFITTYLEPDGLFMLQIIASNASDFVATDLTKQLWKKHFEKYEKILNNEDNTDKINRIEQA